MSVIVTYQTTVMFQFIVKRMGRWIDFENDYKTLYPWFMESVWYVCKRTELDPYITSCCELHVQWNLRYSELLCIINNYSTSARWI